MRMEMEETKRRKNREIYPPQLSEKDNPMDEVGFVGCINQKNPIQYVILIK